MKSTGTLESFQIEVKGLATGSVIWLHGLGADGRDFEPIVSQLGLPRSVRWVFPHAPHRPVTINGGMSMRAWYDIISLDRHGPEDEKGIRASAKAVGAMLATEVSRGVPEEKIVLAGFSQGGALALHVGLRYPKRLAGVVALSTYLPLASTLGAEKSDAGQQTEIFLGHGLLDPVIPPFFGEASKNALEEQGYRVGWNTYTAEHAVCPEEIRDIGTWLRGRL
ncbi:MAG: alpha/beta fold hydrolase [Pseudomonadota bacterium]|nr:alpha/beta fold hydrolase [Pseudomonadota bacterium]